MRAFVIAMQCEADAVRPWLKPDDRLYVSGVGKVNAAAATQRAICEGADKIWNVGLCGGFGDDVEVGDFYGVEMACEYDFDLTQINGVSIGVIDGFDTPYMHCACLPDRPDIPRRILATGDRFNDGKTDHELIVNVLKASLRDMEGAAIAHVCKLNHVKCIEFKCVSDVAGGGSMTRQFRDNRERCLAVMSEAMRDILSRSRI